MEIYNASILNEKVFMWQGLLYVVQIFSADKWGRTGLQLAGVGIFLWTITQTHGDVAVFQIFVQGIIFGILYKRAKLKVKQ
jgi:hypothetical protein